MMFLHDGVEMPKCKPVGLIVVMFVKPLYIYFTNTCGFDEFTLMNRTLTFLVNGKNIPGQLAVFLSEFQAFALNWD